MSPWIRNRLIFLGLLSTFCFLIYCFGTLVIRDLVDRTVSNMSDNLKLASEKSLFQYDYRAEMEKLNAEQVEQDDPGLVRLIRQFYLEPQSVLPYHFTDNKRQDYSQGGQSKYVDTLFNHVVSKHEKT